LCAAQNIKVATFRANACCYEKNTLQYLENPNITYYIRAEKNGTLSIALEDENKWQPAILNNCKVDICNIEEKIFGEDTYRRIVAYRRKLSNEQATIFDKDGIAIMPLLHQTKKPNPLMLLPFTTIEVARESIILKN